MATRAVGFWIVVAGALTLFAGGGYVVAQQTIRHAADHPQIEMAREAASKLNGGASPESVLPKEAIDLSVAGAVDPYLIVVDGSGQVLASSVTLGGAQPLPPPGVFDYVRSHGEDTISWEPKQGVRSAIVIDAFKGGFVIAGRSLLPTETTESNLLAFTGVGWVAAMLLLGVVATLLHRQRSVYL